MKNNDFLEQEKQKMIAIFESKHSVCHIFC